SAAADALDFAVAQPQPRKALSDVVDIRRLSKHDVHVGAALEINAVAEAALEDDRGPTGKQENTAEGVKILRFTHPIDVGFFKELDHAHTNFPSLDSSGYLFVPASVLALICS